MTQAPDPFSHPPLQMRRSLRLGHILLIIAGLAGVGLAVILTHRTTAPPPAAPPTARTVDPREALLAELPAPLTVPLDAVTGGVRLASDALPRPPAELAQAIAEAHKSGPLPPRTIPADHPGLPRQAGELGDALVQKKTLQTTSFELAHLTGAILRHRGLEPEYGFVPRARFAATELPARRFVVRPKSPTGAPPEPWLAPDGGVTTDAVALTPVEYAGNLIAFRALGALARQDADYATRAVAHARRLLPDDAAVLFVVAAAEALSGQPDLAQKTFDAAAALAADAMTYYRLGRLARLDEKPFKAEQLFARAAEADPAFALPHVELAELTLERLDLTPKDGHPELLDKAEAALAAADKADPKAAGLRIARAHLLSLRDDNDTARKLLVEEVELHPYREEGWVVLANVHAAEGDDQAAIKALESALANGVETADVFEGLGTLYASTGRFDEGQRMIERALELNPEDPTYRTQLAQFERHAQRFFKARDLLEAQVKKFPDDTTAALLLAQLELEQQQPGKARLQTERVLARDPNNSEARVFHYLIGVVEERPDQAARAAAVAALGTHRRLAELLLQNGLVQEAESVLQEALKADDGDLVAPVLLVAIYTAQNRLPEATALRESTLANVDPADRPELARLFDEAVAQALQARDNPQAP